MKRIITLLLLTMMTGSVLAQGPSKQELLKAIDECANYAANVLLDEQGKSRCDYNLIEGRWYPYEEPWHTGQVILGILECYKITADESLLKAARKAGDWWMTLEIKDDPKLSGMVAATHGDALGNDHIVFATVSDGTAGIFELSRVTKDMKYANLATSASQWMLENMYYPQRGVCYDYVDLSNGEVLKDKNPFYYTDNPVLENFARPNTEGSPFKDAYEFTKDERFKQAHILLCDSLMTKQDKDGVWMDYPPNNSEVSSFHPRFNLWYAESLLEAYELTKDKKYLEAAAKTARTYAKAQQKDGSIYYVNYTDGKAPDKGSICGSSVAFSGIMWMRLAEYGYEEFIPHYELSAQWLIKNRYDLNHPDENLRGAVINTRYRTKNSKVWLTHRDVGTSLGLRFLAAYYRLKY